jgi:hypothetical protein
VVGLNDSVAMTSSPGGTVAGSGSSFGPKLKSAFQQHVAPTMRNGPAKRLVRRNVTQTGSPATCPSTTCSCVSRVQPSSPEGVHEGATISTPATMARTTLAHPTKDRSMKSSLRIRHR